MGLFQLENKHFRVLSLIEDELFFACQHCAIAAMQGRTIQ
jgi:hypothetical protein